MKTETRKELVLTALRDFVAQRPGLEFGNYGDVKAYRAESRRITRDRHDFDKLCRYVELRDSITDEHLLYGLKHAYSGRLHLKPINGALRAEYTTGQYFPTEYRAAACAVLASAIWEWLRETSPNWVVITAKHSVRRELGPVLTRRWFN